MTTKDRRKVVTRDTVKYLVKAAAWGTSGKIVPCVPVAMAAKASELLRYTTAHGCDMYYKQDHDNPLANRCTEFLPDEFTHTFDLVFHPLCVLTSIESVDVATGGRAMPEFLHQTCMYYLGQLIDIRRAACKKAYDGNE